MTHCPDCSNDADSRVSRRGFVQTVGIAAAAATVGPSFVKADEAAKPAPESLVTKLFNSLSPTQKEEICFDWDHKDDRGLLRMHVSNNWQITGDHKIASGFYTKDQQDMIEALFWGLYSPDWHPRIKKQLQDDAGGYGKEQSIAIFGQPGTGKFEFVMTGRHLTIRCDGHSVDHVAFGGPIFYGHAASGFDEDVHHPGNVSLLPSDPDAAIEVRMMDRVFDNYVMTPQGKCVFDAMRKPGAHDPQGVADAKAMLDTIYVWLDERLKDRIWAVNDSFSLADCAAGPSLFYADWTHPIPANLKNLHAYRARLLVRPSFARAINEARPYRSYFPLGAPDRD